MTRRISYDHLKSDGRVIRISVAVCEDHLAGLGETHLVSVVGDPEPGTCDWCEGREYRTVTHR